MKIFLLENKSFELVFKSIINLWEFNDSFYLEWQENKCRVVPYSWSSNIVMINGQGVDILGYAYGFNIAIEIKEFYGEEVYIKSKINQKQREYLTNFQKRKNHHSFVFLYMHKTNELIIIKWPLKCIKFKINMKEKEGFLIHKWLALDFSDIKYSIVYFLGL